MYATTLEILDRMRRKEILREAEQIHAADLAAWPSNNDSDASDARLVGVEVIVNPATYAKFSAAEKAMWHCHKTEIPLVAATVPDMTPDEVAKVIKQIEDTYGKIYLIWDPTAQTLPAGRPSVTVLPKPK